MNASEVIAQAQHELEVVRKEIVEAAGPSWQQRCLESLQDTRVMNLRLGDEVPCEIAFHAFEADGAERGGRNLSFDDSATVAQAATLAALSSNQAEPGHEMVKFILSNLPGPPTDSLFETLGVYFKSTGSLDTRIEIYWARIAARFVDESSHRRNEAKVVMLHEIAHFVTHRGRNNNKSWECFPSQTDVVEVVAQAAAALTIERLNEREVLEAFECLLKGQPPAYTEHELIIKTLRTEFKDPNYLPEYADFRHLFLQHLQQDGTRRYTTIAAINRLIKSLVVKKIQAPELKRAQGIAGINIDI